MEQRKAEVARRDLDHPVGVIDAEQAAAGGVDEVHSQHHMAIPGYLAEQLGRGHAIVDLGGVESPADDVVGGATREAVSVVATGGE